VPTRQIPATCPPLGDTIKTDAAATSGVSAQTPNTARTTTDNLAYCADGWIDTHATRDGRWAMPFADIAPYVPLFFQGLLLSVYISLISMVAGSLIGLLAYQLKVGPFRPLRMLSSAYIEVFRNVPLLVVLYLVYFGLPAYGLNFDPLWSAIIAMSVNNGAYVAEIVRAGFSSVPLGTREAAHALGMNSWQTFRYVVFVPGIRHVIPALTNQFILLFLFSSVASVISLNELTYELMSANSRSLRTIEVFSLGLILYYGASSILAATSRLGEKVLFRW
jgi:polar amino acid transport system permease protein